MGIETLITTPNMVGGALCLSGYLLLRHPDILDRFIHNKKICSNDVAVKSVTRDELKAVPWHDSNSSPSVK